MNHCSRFSNDCRRTIGLEVQIPVRFHGSSHWFFKQLGPECLAILPGYNWLKEREKSRVQCAAGFGFAFHWLKNWRDSKDINVYIEDYLT